MCVWCPGIGFKRLNDSKESPREQGWAQVGCQKTWERVSTSEFVLPQVRPSVDTLAPQILVLFLGSL